jgi:hypothetical protein
MLYGLLYVCYLHSYNRHYITPLDLRHQMSELVEADAKVVQPCFVLVARFAGKSVTDDGKADSAIHATTPS